MAFLRVAPVLGAVFARGLIQLPASLLNSPAAPLLQSMTLGSGWQLSPKMDASFNSRAGVNPTSTQAQPAQLSPLIPQFCVTTNLSLLPLSIAPTSLTIAGCPALRTCPALRVS